MADRFFVGPGSSWNSAANWSASSGGAGGAGVPGVGDVARFDVNSPSCSIDVNVACQAIRMEATFVNTLTQTAAFTITLTDTTFAFTVDGGTFVGGSGAITAPKLLMTAGSFTSTSGIFTLNFAGVNLNVTGGTFIHNSGTVRFTTTTTPTMFNPTVNKLFNLDTNTGGNFTLAGTLRVAGTLNMRATTNGFLGGGTIECEGDVNALATAGSTYNLMTIKFLGSGDQDFTGVAGGGRTPIVRIDKPSGTLFLFSVIEPNGGWINDNGTVDPGTSRVQLDSGTFKSNGQSFFDLDINGSNLTLSDNADVLGDLRVLANNQLNGFRIDVHGDVESNDAAFGGGDTTEIRLVGTGTQTIGGTTNRWYKFFSIDKPSGVARLLSNMRVDNVAASTFNLIRGELDLDGFNLTVSTAPVIQMDGILRMQGIETVTPNPTFNAGSLCILDGAPGPTNIPNFTYRNLTTEGTGIFVQTAAKTIAEELNIDDSSTWRTAGFTCTAASGLFVNDTGTLEVSGAETLTLPTLSVTSTVIYSGAGVFPSLIAGNAYANVRFNNAGGTWTQTAALNVSLDLTITAGTLNSAGFDIDIQGDWSNSGTYTPGANTVTFDGTNQSILGSTTFNNLTKVISFFLFAPQTWTFDNLGTQTILGTWTAQGSMFSRLALRSDLGGAQWDIDPQGTRDVFLLDVEDSNNINAAPVAVTGKDCADSGNNTNWTFGGTGVAKRGFRVGRVRV